MEKAALAGPEGGNGEEAGPVTGADGAAADVVFLLAAGDTVYAFADVDAASIQYRVLIGANLDVDTFRVTAVRCDEVLAELRAGNTVEVVDARTFASAEG